MSLIDRLRRLEARPGAGGCPTCRTWGLRVIWDGVLDANSPPAECPQCGRQPRTINVVYGFQPNPLAGDA
jgi:hypothetical protein